MYASLDSTKTAAAYSAAVFDRLLISSDEDLETANNLIECTDTVVNAVNREEAGQDLASSEKAIIQSIPGAGSCRDVHNAFLEREQDVARLDDSVEGGVTVFDDAGKAVSDVTLQDVLGFAPDHLTEFAHG